MELLEAALFDPNGRWVLGGTLLLGLAAGVLGGFALLRRRALMGDTLAHAALPGIAIAFLVTGTKSVGPLLVGALIAGLLGTGAISLILHRSKLKEDTAMGIVLSVFFGVGILLLTVIQKLPNGNQSGLDKFLFGQAASLVGADVRLMAGAAGFLCLIVLLLWKELKLLAFDPAFGRGLGLPMGLLDLLMNGLVAAVVVVGLQAVGVVLMAALLITPPIAARYWTERLGVMVGLSGLFGAISGVGGTLFSLAGARLPTGPLIVLTATALFIVSLLFAPQRGLVARLWRFLQLQRRVAAEGLLRALYEEAERAGAPQHPATIADLQRRGLVERAARTTAARLVVKGWVARQGESWHLTREGLAAAHRLVVAERRWSVYLMHEADLGGAPVDRDRVGAVDWGALTPELDRLMALHQLTPRLMTLREVI